MERSTGSPARVSTSSTAGGCGALDGFASPGLDKLDRRGVERGCAVSDNAAPSPGLDKRPPGARPPGRWERSTGGLQRGGSAAYPGRYPERLFRMLGPPSRPGDGCKGPAMTATHTTGTPLRSGSDLNPTTPEGAAPADPRREPARLQQDLRDHLLLNFTDMSEFADSRRARVHPRRRLLRLRRRRPPLIDGISGLFCTNLGHSLRRRGRPGRPAAAGRAGVHPVLVRRAPGRAPSWPSGSPTSPRLGACTRVFFTSGGGEANEAAWKLARQWHAANGQPQRRKAIARRLAVPRHLAGRAVLHRPAVRRHAVRAAADPDRARQQHQRLPAPARARRGGVHRGAARRGGGDDRVGGPGNRRDAHRRAGAELRRLASPRRPATGRACARCATSTASCSSPTRSSPASAASATGSRRSGTASAPT